MTTHFDEVFRTSFDGSLSSDGILRGVPKVLMKVEDFEKSPFWQRSWITMDQALEEMKPSERKRVVACWYEGHFRVHPNQLVHPSYMDEDGLLSKAWLVRVTAVATALSALKDHGEITIEPIHFLLRFVKLQSHAMEMASKSPVGRQLLASICYANPNYNHPLFTRVYQAGKALRDSRGGEQHVQGNSAVGQKHARDDSDDEMADISIHVRR